MSSQTSGSPGIGDTGSGMHRNFQFSHDGCHDEHMEESIGALTPLVPSVLSFVVVISSVNCAKLIGLLPPMVPSDSVLLLCLSCNFVTRGSVC